MGSSAIDHARELSPLIKRLRDETEGSRRIAAPIVERLRETGLCRIAVPRELKGLELPLLEALDVYEALAAAEASVAWVVWNNALPCLFGRFLDATTRASVFGDPTWLYASSTRPTGQAAVAGVIVFIVFIFVTPIRDNVGLMPHAARAWARWARDRQRARQDRASPPQGRGRAAARARCRGYRA